MVDELHIVQEERRAVLDSSARHERTLRTQNLNHILSSCQSIVNFRWRCSHLFTPVVQQPGQLSERCSQRAIPEKILVCLSHATTIIWDSLFENLSIRTHSRVSPLLLQAMNRRLFEKLVLHHFEQTHSNRVNTPQYVAPAPNSEEEWLCHT